MPQTSRTIPNSLVDSIRPAEADGRLIGAVFSTYSLSLDQADFFGKDFMPTLVGVGGVQSRGYSSPVALDRELAKSDIVLICDAHAVAAGARPSLRIDVTPIGDQVHHAKIHLIHRENLVRLIVGSANLTDEGFRRQREVAVVLDFCRNGYLSPEILRSAVEGWLAALGNRASKRAKAILNAAVKRVSKWPTKKRAIQPPTVRVLFGGSLVPLWQELVRAWPQGEPVEHWTICSPFWPAAEGSHCANPFEQIARGLKAKKASLEECEIEIIAPASAPGDTALPRFPFSLISELRGREFPIRAGIVRPARLEAGDDEVPAGMATGNRELHAKWVALRGPETVVVLAGSANFTRQGMGTMQDPLRANIEACVLLTAARGHLRPEYWLPPIQGIEVPWQDREPGRLAQSQDEIYDKPDWPAFIDTIYLRINWQSQPEPDGVLEVETNSACPDSFFLSVEGTETTSAASRELRQGHRQTSFRVPLSGQDISRLLVRRSVEILWDEPKRRACYPVNIHEQSKGGLPTVLSAKPTESELLAYFRGRIAEEDLLAELLRRSGQPTPTSERAVPETSRQLQNYIVRDFVESLFGMEEVLAKSSFSIRAAEQALLGEFSPVVLAGQILDALKRGHRSPTAAAFQLAELIRVVANIKWPATRRRKPTARSEYERIRQRALSRLFTLVRFAAGSNPGFCAALSDSGFTSFVGTTLGPALAGRLHGPFRTATAKEIFKSTGEES